MFSFFSAVTTTGLSSRINRSCGTTQVERQQWGREDRRLSLLGSLPLFYLSSSTWYNQSLLLPVFHHTQAISPLCATIFYLHLWSLWMGWHGPQQLWQWESQCKKHSAQATLCQFTDVSQTLFLWKRINESHKGEQQEVWVLCHFPVTV